MRFIPSLLLACVSMSTLPLHAATLDDLYQVREPVSSQQPDARNQALQAALDTLVLRLTGHPEALKNPTIAGLRNDPQQIVSQYGYDNDRLVVDFDPVSTDRSLRQAGLPLWGASRPALVTWWLDQAEDGTNNLSGDNQASAQAIRAAAQYRGLPVRMPLADLEEQLVATPENLASAASGPLTEASGRYSADGVLTVRSSQQDGQWKGEWQLALGDLQDKGTAQADSRETLADTIMRTVSERLAPRFAVAPGSSSAFEVQISNVDLNRYAELQRVLEPFDGRMISAGEGNVRYQLNANEQQLKAQLGLIHAQEAPAPESPAPLDAQGQPMPPQDTSGGRTLYFAF